MPGFRVPKHSGIHRFATRALFRTLLREARHTLLPAHARSTLQTAIKDKFHRNHHAQGQYIRDATALGHKTLRVLRSLHSAPGSDLPAPVTRLVALASQLYPAQKMEKLRAARLRTRQEHEEQAAARERERKRDPLERAAEKAWHVFDRPMPRERLSGRRKIPNFVIASGYPFLRYAKPQPEYLSGMLRYKLARRQRLAPWLRELEDAEMELARDEDEWDGILRGICGVGDADRVRFVAGVEEGIRQVKAWLDADSAERKNRAGKLFAVHLKEKELALKENEEDRVAMRLAEAKAEAEAQAAAAALNEKPD